MLESLRLFPEVLKQARLQKHWSQSELAARAGISLMTVRRYEAGESLPDMEVLGNISLLFPNDNLPAAWANSWLKKNTPEGETGRELWKERTNLYQRARNYAESKYWKDLMENGDSYFINKIIKTARYYQDMTEEGVDKAIEIISLLSKIPDYQTATPWKQRETAAQKDDKSTDEKSK